MLGIMFVRNKYCDPSYRSRNGGFNLNVSFPLQNYLAFAKFYITVKTSDNSFVEKLLINITTGVI